MFVFLFRTMDEAHEKFIWNFAIIAIFSVINFFLSKADKKAFFSNKEFTPLDAVYFTTITHFTIGYGDYYPTSPIAKILTIAHVILTWFINFVDLGLVKKFSPVKLY